MKYLIPVVCLFCCSFILANEEKLIKSYEFVSIEYLVEQEVGRIVLPIIYKNVGLTLNITPVPADRAQHLATSGLSAGEIMRIWSYGEENSQMIRVPTPYYYLETMAFIIKDSGVMINHQKDLQNYRLAKVKGVKHTNNITYGLTDVYNTSSTEQMFKLLINGKVDAVLTNTMDGLLVAERLGYSNIVKAGPPLAEEPLYIYIHQNFSPVVPIIDNEIKQLKFNGKLDKLLRHAEQQIINYKH